MALEQDPAGFKARLPQPACLRKFVVTRANVEENAEGLLQAMEGNIIPKSYHDSLILMLWKAMQRTKTDIPDQCPLIDTLLDELLSQLAGDMFKK